MAERGPLIRYQIIWKSGHVEEILAHQISTTGGSRWAYESSGPEKPEVVRFHGEFGGHWQLVLSAAMDEIATIRNLSVASEEADCG